MYSKISNHGASLVYDCKKAQLWIYLTWWHSGISFTLDSSQVALQSFDKIIHLGISSILYCAVTMLHRCYRDIVYTCQAVYWSIKGAKMAIKRIERENYENCWPSIQIFINCHRCRSGTSLRSQIIKRNCRYQQNVSIIYFLNIFLQTYQFIYKYVLSSHSCGVKPYVLYFMVKLQ